MNPGWWAVWTGTALALAGCAAVQPVAVTSESLDFGGQAYSLRYTPTGDTVPNFAVGTTIQLADGTTAIMPVDPFVTVAYPTVRIGGTSDKFEALAVWYSRCAPGETFDQADFGDEVFSLDDRTKEYVFTYPCPPLSGVGGAQG